MSALDSPAPTYLKDLIEQIRTFDRFLGIIANKNSEVVLWMILDRLAAQMHADKLAADANTPPMPQKPADYPALSPELDAATEVQSLIKRVMWARALLFSFYIDTLVDTSDIADTPLGRRIVPIL